jgi:hypothetical protein
MISKYHHGKKEK